jgi:orotidine-5'-phosphate decarboxylase
MNEARSKLIVALDVPDRRAALAAVDRLAGHVGCFKLGLEIFVREGPALVEEIRRRDESVFLDLKLHDIPNTVAGAVRSACRLGVQMLTLHAAGGAKMLETARLAAEGFDGPPMLLAVTALTSLSQSDADSIGIARPIEDWVEALATIAREAGIRGLVASPIELPRLRRRFGPEVRLVIPGIRPTGTEAHDQARIAHPADAVRAGADFLVVGRPILQSEDPGAAADRIVEEINIGMANSRQSAKS